MKLLIIAALALSLSGCAMLQKKSAPQGAPFICDGSAYLDYKKYELPELTSTDELEYDKWVDNLAVKYPNLLNGYVTLRDCVRAYHKI